MNAALPRHSRIFVENLWYAAAWEHQIAQADNRLARTICERPLVFYRGDSGRYVCLDNRCCHRAAPLSLGRVEGDCLRCMYHGILYDADGQGVEIPGQDRVAKTIRVRSYPAVEKGGMVWVWMGDPELANPDDIYDFPPLSDPDNWRGFDERAYLHYQANWLLIVDNLADFSHVAFVHTNTLGGSEAYAYTTAPERVDHDDDGFRMVRWHDDSKPAPFHAKVLPPEERDQKVDRGNITSMRLPGVFHMETVFAPVGWDKANNDRSLCHEYRNAQFMTPETRNTTHFFWDYLHNRNRDDPEVTESLRQSLLQGFYEDKVFIEGQQKLLSEDPSFVPRVIAADAEFQHFRRVWAKRLKAEDEASPLVATENKKRIL